MLERDVHSCKLVVSFLQMIITLSLVYNIQCFSGMIFQFVAESVHRKKKSAMDVLAAGGRYDKLVSLNTAKCILPSVTPTQHNDYAVTGH